MHASARILAVLDAVTSATEARRDTVGTDVGVGNRHMRGCTATGQRSTGKYQPGCRAQDGAELDYRLRRGGFKPENGIDRLSSSHASSKSTSSCLSNVAT